jgi:hypothetical protein
MLFIRGSGKSYRFLSECACSHVRKSHKPRGGCYLCDCDVFKEKAATTHRWAVAPANRPRYNGRLYASNAEREYAEGLDWRLKANEFKSWRPQPRLSIDINGVHVCDYVIDFEIEHHDGRIEYVEVKGFPTDLWRLKWRVALAKYKNDPMVVLTLVKA